jgi:hypothetical protein
MEEVEKRRNIRDQPQRGTVNPSRHPAHHATSRSLHQYIVQILQFHALAAFPRAQNGL